MRYWRIVWRSMPPSVSPVAARNALSAAGSASVDTSSSAWRRIEPRMSCHVRGPADVGDGAVVVAALVVALLDGRQQQHLAVIDSPDAGTNATTGTHTSIAPNALSRAL